MITFNSAPVKVSQITDWAWLMEDQVQILIIRSLLAHLIGLSRRLVKQGI